MSKPPPFYECREADRLLSSQRTHGQRGLSTTRAGTLLKQQIPICQLFSAFDETAVERTRREKSVLRLRLSENSPPTTAPVRGPACPETAGTARGRPRA